MQKLVTSAFTFVALVWSFSALAQAASFDAASNTLTLPSVLVSGTTYKNVVVRLDKFAVISAESPSVTSTLRLEIIDVTSAANGGAPLRDNPYRMFSFKLNGDSIKIQSNAIDSAQTYTELLSAIQYAIYQDPRLQNYTAKLGGSFTAFDTSSGLPVYGTSIEISGEGVIETGYFVAANTIPTSSSIHSKMSVSSYSQ